MREFHDTDDFRGARFTAVDLSGARFRNVDLSGAKVIDAMLVNATLSGMIDGLTINNIEVAPLILAEMDRLYPERARLIAREPEGLREAWSTIEAMWQATTDRARGLPEETLRTRVDEEWSFGETMRHLIFVTDSWISRAVLGEARPYHPLALPPSFVTGKDLVDVGIDDTADPAFAEVLEARADRLAVVRHLLAGVTAEELARRCDQNPAPGYPRETTQTVLDCIHVVIDEEWAHHRYAVRDLDALAGNSKA
jgi:DinB superfamily/Pentapeptide repeats (8 copies)